jgi:GNAT superfamily N-acetyltransferase
MTVTVETVAVTAAGEVAAMAGELLEEIMAATGVRHFSVDLEQTAQQLGDFIDNGIYAVFAARVGGSDKMTGFIALCETHALYAQGVFGIVPELYVRPAYRSQGVGARLIDVAIAYGRKRGWKRLEVTTPPLPEFDRTLAFYERRGFAVTGGRKMKLAI